MMDENHRISINSENERLIYKAYSDEKAEREKLERVVQQMHRQIETLQQQLNDFTTKAAAQKASQSDPSNSQHTEYSTDEEELARETEWIRVKNRKKRKLNTSHSSPQSQQETHSDKNPVVKKIPPPPPIIVDNVKNYQIFYDILLEHIPKESFTAKMLKGDSVKVNVKEAEHYRVVTKLFLEKSCLWHSYENKQARPIRVVAKGLHSTCQPEKIVEDLKDKGLNILDAVNKLRWKNKEPLNMFMLTFTNDEDIKKIYAIKCILGCKVDIHPMKTSKLVPQCKRCQSYGHTQKYCQKEPRCVKCTGKHLTKDCNKPLEEKPKCVHCGEAHPANYRGCIVAKEMQSMKNKSMQKKNPAQSRINVVNSAKPANLNPKVVQQKIPNTQGNKTFSYAQITSKNLNNAQNKSTTSLNINIEEKLNNILHYMSSFDERLKVLERSAKVAPLKQK